MKARYTNYSGHRAEEKAFAIKVLWAVAIVLGLLVLGSAGFFQLEGGIPDSPAEQAQAQR